MKLIPKYQKGDTILKPTIHNYDRNDARYYTDQQKNNIALAAYNYTNNESKYGHNIKTGDFYRNSKTGKIIGRAPQALINVSPEFDVLSLGGGFYKDVATAIGRQFPNLVSNNIKSRILGNELLKSPISRINQNLSPNTISVVGQKEFPYRIEWDNGLNKPVYKEIPTPNYNGELIVPITRSSNTIKRRLPSNYVADSKIATPRIYNRSKNKNFSIPEEAATPIKKDYKEYKKWLFENGLDDTYEHGQMYIAQTNGRGDTRLMVPNGVYNILSNYKAFRNDVLPSSVNTKFSNEVYNNYLNAISRHSDYSYPIDQFIDRGRSILFKPFKRDNTVLSGFLNGKNNDIYTVSHFAPSSLRKGYEAIQELSKSEMPSVLCVPNMLSKQLYKAGFNKIGTVPQPFGDRMVLKDVMVNNAVTDDDVNDLIKYFLGDRYETNF